MTTTVSTPSEPIAVVGSGCRFPGSSSSPSSLWNLLKRPHDLRQEIHADRYSTNGFYHHDGSRHGRSNVRHSYLLEEDVRLFDAAFFNISPNEAEAIDPQQRILLETVYEALEAGGHTLEGLRGSDTSVYVGTMTVDYHDHLLRDPNAIPTYFATGINRAIISNRVSYFFDWHGPSMTIDTACSSSLIAVHQGVQALRNGESRVSVACGTQILLGYDMYIGESNLKMLSPNGRSRMWDADADGYARGEGVAAVVMKRLCDALADGDHIECIIRETGANQDGFSNGITVPSAEAQAALIRKTYAKAGLDPERNPDHRPQYFEAHGTGTQTGDPKEAAAIHDTFGQYIDGDDGTPLYVGSIKTVVGHLEGAAGLAGLLKASACLQNGAIPPNLSFDRLNPKIEPFYKGLKVPTSLTAWPPLPEGVPRRVSVNSFGFGGANAHAILEQHVSPELPSDNSAAAFSPFVFSALNETSLVALLEQYSQILKARCDDINVSDLAWTLHSRRSQFSTRVAFSASTIQQLSEKIDSKLEALKQQTGSTIGTRSAGKPPSPRILGVFTGQGAQWPGMGAQLIRSSSFVRQIIHDLEESLATLPTADRPSWSLYEELLAGPESSRISEAALSQPLCTAIQIVLVDLLRTAGVNLASVVGHSSGEIAAAYAAGFFSAQDAIRIAYYRGLYAYLAGNTTNGQKGAMLAAGTSWEDAQELVNLETLKGRLTVAAHNSSASVTLSGDADAILDAKKLLDEQKKFARLLKVDTAYHSHHMNPCGDLYTNALRECGIRVEHDPNTDCAWYSSVTASTTSMGPTEELQDMYWKDNMTGTVLFSEAIHNAVSNDDSLNMVLEIGPHPALKGPAMQNIADIRSDPLPYSGMLNRGGSDVEAFADALGYLWATLGTKAVNLQSFEDAVANERCQNKLVLDLPSYQWDHRKAHWSESRRSKRLRSREEIPHELLGVLSPESNTRDMRWSNTLKLGEIPWIEGHRLQGLVVFPAAGYIAMAMEACRSLTDQESIELFELRNLSIPRAITFEDGDSAGVETLVTLTTIERHSDEYMTAAFSIYSAPSTKAGADHDMELVASGDVCITLGPANLEALPCDDSALETYNMTDVDTERVYDMFSKLGYDYTGPFKGMSSMKRRLNHASALVDAYAYSEDEYTFYLVHPSMLDVAIQSSMLAYSSPGDERLWSLHVPTHVGTIRVNPEVCNNLSISGCKVPISTTLDTGSEHFSASINILSEDGRYSMIQVEDLMLKPFAPPSAAEDRWMYSSTKLNVAVPDASSLEDLEYVVRPVADDENIAIACERISYYYLRQWKADISDVEWNNCSEPHYLHLRSFVEHTVARASNEQHPTIKSEWADDTAEYINTLISKYSNDSTIKLLSSVGENMPAAVRGKTCIQEHMESNGLLEDYYSNGHCISKGRDVLTRMVKQLTARYPRSRIIEIGAGNGAATKQILAAIKSHGGAKPSYTFTDVSSNVTTMAAELLQKENDIMTFRVLDAELEPAAQGYELYTYDIVIVSNSLYATKSLKRSLENIRQLLKPGGYLLLLEMTDTASVQFSTIMGGLPSWWRGVEDDRKYVPSAAPATWHSTLQIAGFGGIDSIAPQTNGSGSAWPFSVMAAQAIDEQVLFLRQPLSTSPSQSFVSIDSLVILGTESLETLRIAEKIIESVKSFCGRITMLKGLPNEEEILNLEPMSTFLNLADLDSPIFKAITKGQMDGLNRVIELARHVLWVTHGAQLGDEPYSAASLAFCRSISNEATHISFSSLDISGMDESVPKIIAEQLLRQCALEEFDQQGLLWSQEPEMVFHHGKLLIPRILPNLDQNARLNAARRTISKTISASTSNFSIVNGDTLSSPTPVESILPLSKINKESQKTMIEAESSSLMALSIGTGSFLFLVIGKSLLGVPIIALSATNSRITETIISLPMTSNVDPIQDTHLLTATTNELLALALIRSLPPRSSVLVNCLETDQILAAALARCAKTKFIRVTFWCVAIKNQDTSDVDRSWARISDRAPNHIIRRKLVSVRPTHFLDFAGSHPNSHPAKCLGRRIAQVLPPSCKLIELSEVSQCKASLSLSIDHHMLIDHLQDALSAARSSLQATSENQRDRIEANILQLDHIDQQTLCQRPNSIIRWPKKEEQLKVQVRPVSDLNLFSKDKTYVLFGLSGQVGQSLCEWMVANGAGCVCLTSRKAKVDPRWLDSFGINKSMVKILETDITDGKSLEKAIKEIRATCPPIAGIVNGANVLSDAPFSSMTVDMMIQTLRPKVDGSYNLDQAFYEDDLDFFILFSSISTVIGTSGQSNYVAANGYMNGLARQRRRRGLAASAIDIGLILGIGVAQAAGQNVVDSLQKYGITPLSESDLRLAFAESIIAGYPNPSEDFDAKGIPAAVITSGLRTITALEKNIVWYNNPIFSHLVIDAADSESVGEHISSKAITLPVKEQIAMAGTKEEAVGVIRECFSVKLRAILQSPDAEISHDAPLVELGIDSLVAVAVRSWFLKTLKVDIPVLKIVGGSTLDEICQLAMDRLPDDLVSSVGSDTNPSQGMLSKLADKPSDSQSNTPQSGFRSTHTGSSSPGSDTGNSTTSQQTTPLVHTPISTTTQSSLSAQLLSLKDDLTEPTKTKLNVMSPVLSSRATDKIKPISIGQSRFWFLNFLVEDPTTFNVTLSFRLNGNVRVGDLEKAIRVVTARHESLRTCFIADEFEADQAYQKILNHSKIRLERKNIGSTDDVAAECKKLRNQEFDLGTGPLLRMLLLTLSPTSHYLLFSYHHIIMDMASFQVFTLELNKVYNGQPLGPLPCQYPDFSVSQRQALERGELDEEFKYWQSVFPNGEQPPVLSLLPMSRSSSRVATTNYTVHQVSIRVQPDVSAQIKSISKSQRCTPFHFYLAAFKAMLFSFTDDQDLTIGIADANRLDSSVLGSIGFFLNLLTLRFHREQQKPFVDAMAEARNTAYAALSNSRLPFDVLLKELNVARSSTYSPFFQAFFDYRQQTSERQNWCNCQFELDEMHPGRTAYDISLDVADLGSDVHVTLRVQQSLYDLTAAKLLLETYSHFIDTVVQDISLPLEKIPLFSKKQLAHATQIGQGLDLASTWPSTLPHRIDEIAEENASKMALVDGSGDSMTYSAMIKRVEAIAEALLEDGIDRGSRVLVFQQASIDWICSLLAIMRVGGVYVPLDLRNPMERLAAQAEHCNSKAVLVDNTTIGDASQLKVTTVIDVSRVLSAPSADARVVNIAHPDSPAAILYTSGSTGTPKGIVIRHSGIRNEIEGYTKTYKLGAERVLQQSAFTFDFSIDQIFTGLVNGGTLYIVPWSKRGDPLAITEIMRDQSITYTKVTPSEYSMWMQYGGENLRQASSWRFAFGGGEPLTKSLLQQFHNLGLERLGLYNSYGPAEISIASHKGLVDYHREVVETPARDGPAPCGFSLPNYATYILDKNLEPLPVGMPGEVVIGGAGVSFGYLTNQELTSRAFVPNPYATSKYLANGWTHMHRTGDIGHLQEDGSLVFRNRVAGDTQVKLRGLRIDLCDVEANIITAADGVLKDVVVTLREGDPDYLVAHVVFAQPQRDTNEEDTFLKNLLGRLPIPQYMIPILAIPLDTLPLTSHSKADRKAIRELALPQHTQSPDDGHSDGGEVTETMAQLRQVWRQVLPNSEILGLAITPETSFFLVGGNSLLIVRLQSHIRQVFRVALRLVDLLNANTLGQMSRKIEESPCIELIDWDLETSPPVRPNFLKEFPTKSESGTRTVLVTGATGNLARHLLPLLSADQRVGKICCIIRDKPRERDLLYDSKVVYHIGDLSLPLLGLGVDEFVQLAEQADVVLHLGAIRSFWDSYHTLRATNVHSTKELVKLAAARRIKIHFVSTSGVLSAPYDSCSFATCEPPVDGSNGYVASKWASERILEHAAASELRVPSSIYRLLPASAQAQSQTKISKGQAMDEFVRCVDLAGAVPDTSGWDGRIDLIPNELVSAWLCESLLEPELPCTDSARVDVTTARFLHYESPITVQVDELDNYIKEHRGKEKDLERLPILKWFGRIKALGFRYILASQEATVRSKQGGDELMSRR